MSVPRMPAVTVATRTHVDLALVRAFAATLGGEAERAFQHLQRGLEHAPCAGCISSSTRRPFSPSLTTLPSASLSSTREPPPVAIRRRAQLHADHQRRALAVAARPTPASARLRRRHRDAACAAAAATERGRKAAHANTTSFERPIRTLPATLQIRFNAAGCGGDDIVNHSRTNTSTNMQSQYEPDAQSSLVQQEWAARNAFRAHRRHGQAQVLLPVDVPLPLGQAAHGARAQLHHRRRALPLPPHAGLQRAAADGLGCVRPARRERGDGERRAAGEVDLRQHRLHEEAAASRWASPSTGSASSRPARPTTTAGTSGCSCACWKRASPTRRPAW